MNRATKKSGQGKGKLQGKPYPEKRNAKSLGDTSVARRSYREDHNTEEPSIDMIYGKNSVSEALKSGRSINKVLLSNSLEPRFIDEMHRVCKACGIVTQQVENHRLDQLCPYAHQGVVALVAPFQYVEVEDILARAAERGEDPLIVILAEVEDPHNLGAILRTAECAGAHGVIIPKRRAAAVTEVVAKVAAGAAEYMPVARVGNLNQEIEKLKAAGVWICGADMAGKQTLWQAPLTGPLAIVLGSEGQGIPALVAKNCDFLVQIPMQGKISSLNVSASGALLLYEAMRQRTMAEV